MKFHLDFETYNEAGFEFDGEKFVKVEDKTGVKLLGACAYSEHPSTEVTVLWYSVNGVYDYWYPGLPLPTKLFEAVTPINAWNSLFEYYIWNNVCVKKYGWPLRPFHLFFDTAAKARAASLPGKLEKAAIVAGCITQKADPKYMKLLMQPKKPTKKDPSIKHTRELHPEIFEGNSKYCRIDVEAETELDELLPDLRPEDYNTWLLDQRINIRGMQVDTVAVDNLIRAFKRQEIKLNAELQSITNGEIESATEVKKLVTWLNANGLVCDSVAKDNVEEMLEQLVIELDASNPCYRVLEIRKALGSASVRKLFAIKNQTASDGRLHGLYIFNGAHTGRWTAVGPQPQNLPSSPMKGWEFEDIEDAIGLAANDKLEEVYGEKTLSAIAGCLRACIISKPGHDLICSDYKAIEAVVVACVAGEQWRIEVFKGDGRIYEKSASKVTGISFQEFLDYPSLHGGKDHPMRKQIGKPLELGCAYGGGTGACKNFGADEFLTDEEIQDAVKKWREESPMIVALWKGLERAAINAVKNPGKIFTCRGIKYYMQGKVLKCELLSGRSISYNNARTREKVTPWGSLTQVLVYECYNTNPKFGKQGWITKETWGGSLTENVVQAIANDIQRHGMMNLERAGYNIIIHCHDEVCSEVSETFGNFEEFEKLMTSLPDWCNGWPIKASGTWRGKRYKK